MNAPHFHICRVADCDAVIANHMLMCGRCWGRLSLYMQHHVQVTRTLHAQSEVSDADLVEVEMDAIQAASQARAAKGGAA